MLFRPLASLTIALSTLQTQADTTGSMVVGDLEGLVSLARIVKESVKEMKARLSDTEKALISAAWNTLTVVECSLLESLDAKDEILRLVNLDEFRINPSLPALQRVGGRYAAVITATVLRYKGDAQGDASHHDGAIAKGLTIYQP
ncbi:hypothetical protein PT974_00207 [Cladobotryum mycophilum]|uniref:Uncharacterized protein n=1 Tax=Cladobotryum mycophilum TaxID=491253 RepID=A0ABR0T071_9HYPO